MTNDIEPREEKESTPVCPSTSNATSILIVDDNAAMRAALKASLGAEPLSGFERVDGPFPDEKAFYSAVASLSFSPGTNSLILINVHFLLFERTCRSDCLGLRVFDELILHYGNSCPPLLLYSPMDSARLSAYCESRMVSTSEPWYELPARLSGPSGHSVTTEDLARAVGTLLSRLPGKLFDASSDQHGRWTKVNTPDLIKMTALSYVEQVHARIRHRFVGYQRSIVRLLLGSELLKEIETSRHSAARALLVQLTGDQSVLLELETQRYEQARHLAEKTVGPVSSLAKSRKVLLVDDEGHSDWKAALKSIFPWEIDAFPSPELVALDDTYRQYDFILLDFALAEDKTSADWLRKAKALYPEVPVVMFTNFDLVDAALWCLQHGANAYFVKEPYEPTLRSSVDHLLRLVRLFNAVDATDSREMLGMWSANRPEREFVHLVFREMCDAISAADAALLDAWVGAPSIEWHLGRLVRNLLATYSDFYYSRGATLDTKRRLQEVALGRISYHLEVALEGLAFYWWTQNRPGTISDAEHQRFLRLKGGWPKQWRHLRDFGYMALPFDDLVGLPGRGRISHWPAFIPNSTIPKWGAIKTGLEKNLMPAIRAIPSPPARGHKPLLPALPAQRPPPRPIMNRRGSAGASHSSHQQLLGARQLIEGFCENCSGNRAAIDTVVSHLNSWANNKYEPSNGELDKLVKNLDLKPHKLQSSREPLKGLKDIVSQLIIVDDQPFSAFVSALRLILQSLLVPRVTTLSVFEPATVDSAVNSNQLALILLDLDHGHTKRPIGDKGGEAWLKKLRLKPDWSTPVTILSARTDSLTLNDILRAGALDYLPKRISGRDSKEAFDYLLTRLGNLTQMYRDISDLRKIECQIRNLTPPPNLNSFLAGKDRKAIFGPEANEPWFSSMEVVSEAVQEAMLSAWSYLYLNVTRSLRTDLWLDVISQGSDKALLLQAILDMGVAVEPVILLTRARFNPKAFREIDIEAGSICIYEKGAKEFKRILGQSLAAKFREIWEYRNKCEHPGPTILSALNVRDCIRRLGDCVSAIEASGFLTRRH